MKEQILFNPDNSCADICRTIKHSYNGCRANGHKDGMPKIAEPKGQNNVRNSENKTETKE